MKKISVVLTILLSFVFLAACVDETLIVVTVHPSAEPLLITMTNVAKTVEALAQSATAFGSTVTPLPPSPTFTPVPDPNEINKILTDAIHGELIWIFGSKITLLNVSFGPVGANELTELYIEVECENENNSVCPFPQVTSALIDTCKGKKNKVKENVPENIRTLVITIHDPGHPIQYFEVDWSDVVAYFEGKVPPEIFIKLIRHVQR